MKKSNKLISTFLFLILFLLIILSALFVIIQLQSRLLKTKNTIQELEQTISTLKQENEELQKKLEELSTPATTPEAEPTATPLPLEPEVIEPIYSLDIESLEAGTIVSADQINRESLESYFQSNPISDDVYARINGKSYRENNNIGLSDLRYIKLLHYNFNHEIQVGELIVNAGIAEDITSIFRELFEAEYEIQSMYLIDRYWTGDGGTTDTASIEENNTSAFCYRAVTGGSSLSNHAYGRAIDINPQQNPYVSYRSGSPHWSHSNANDYIARDTGYAHVITHDDLCYQVFSRHGFSWGGDWDTIKDYQHFEKKS